MDFQELIGFIISLIVLVFFLFRGREIPKIEQEYGEEEKKNDEALKHFFESIGWEEKEEVAVERIGPPPLKPAHKKTKKSAQPIKEKISLKQEDSSHSVSTPKTSKGTQILKEHKNLQEMVVFAEIIGKPKSLRFPEF